MCCNHNMKKWWSTLENSTGGSFTHKQMSALGLPQFKIQCYASRWFPQALWTWVLVESKYLHRVGDGWAAKVSHISGSGCVREKNERGRCSLCDLIPQTISILRAYMRQCQIRVRFESRGSQIFKALGKCFLMTKYAAIIIIWCIERGFYKRTTWSPVLAVFTNALITWQRKYLY